MKTIIITPCSRPENLPIIYESIKKLKEYLWIICFDVNKVPAIDASQFGEMTHDGNIKMLFASCPNSVFGNGQRNVALKHAYSTQADGWLVLLDDDNILHPDQINFINTGVSEEFQLYIFKQVFKDGTNRLNHHYGTDFIVEGRVDSAQIIARFSNIKNRVFFEEEVHGADGRFIVAIKDISTIALVEGCSYYNFLGESVGTYNNYWNNDFWKLMNRIHTWAYSNPPVMTLDLQGWMDEANFMSFFNEISFDSVISILEVGSWKGLSACKMAQALKDKGKVIPIVALDTWLGSYEHLDSENEFNRFNYGYPDLYFRFLSNVTNLGLQKYIFPFPIASNQGVYYLMNKGVKFNVIYIDAGHDYESVKNDITLFWNVLADGGVMLIDDTDWVSVKRAIDEFCELNGISYETRGLVTRIIKRTSKI